MQYKISVIIPVYNAEKYLRACFDSLVNQTYKSIEVLIVDDGSSDISPQICDEYADKYGNFVVFHKENGGCSSARNMGLQKATGEYVAFVDADDCLDADYYEILMKALRDINSDISACAYVNEYSEDISLIKIHDKIPETIVFDGADLSLESMTAKVNSIEGFVWNKIWNRNILEGIMFRTDVAIVDDAVFTWEVVSKVKRTCFVNLPMYHYRIINSSITRNSGTEKYLRALYGYELMIEDAAERVPKCLDGLCTDYIIWNIKTLERMIFMRKPDLLIYKKVRENILRVGEYVNKCSGRHKFLAKGALRSWNTYRMRAVLIWRLKQIFFRIMR